MEFTKFNAEKCRKDFKKDVEAMDYETLWNMYKGISLYWEWLIKYTARKYGASKRVSDILEIHKITAHELLKRLNKETKELPY